MSENFQVIVSHAGKQGNVYHRPWAAERAGLDVRFLTGLYYKPDRFPYRLVRWLPGSRRKRVQSELEKRRIEGLSPDNVVGLLGPLLELALRPVGLFDLWFAAHDWLVSKWIRRQPRFDRLTVLHCFQGCALRTLRAAGSKRMVRLFETTLPPMGAATLARWGISSGTQPDNALFTSELQATDFVLVQSDYGYQAVQEHGIPANKIFRVHLGVDTRHFQPRTAPRRPGPLRVLFLGTLSRRKGVHHLLEAWRSVQADAELLFVGNSLSPDAAELAREVAGSTSCKLIGWISSEAHLDLIQQADMLVHPSLAEGGCNAVYEALACGVPCVITNTASSSVRSGIEGLVVPPGDIGALGAAIQRLCDEPELRARMGAAARLRAESLSWEHYAENLAGLYRGLAEFAKHGDSSVLEPMLNKGF